MSAPPREPNGPDLVLRSKGPLHRKTSTSPGAAVPYESGKDFLAQPRAALTPTDQNRVCWGPRLRSTLHFLFVASAMCNTTRCSATLRVTPAERLKMYCFALGDWPKIVLTAVFFSPIIRNERPRAASAGKILETPGKASTPAVCVPSLGPQ